MDWLVHSLAINLFHTFLQSLERLEGWRGWRRMDHSEDDGRPFHLHDLWAQPTIPLYTIDTSFGTTLAPLTCIKSQHLHFELYNLPNTSPELTNKLEPLDTFPKLNAPQEDPLKDIPSLSSSLASLGSADEEQEPIDHTLWLEAGTWHPQIPGRHQTWEQFYNRNFHEAPVAYVGESGAMVLDALVQIIDTKRGADAITPLLWNAVTDCLKHLFFARDSRLFSYNSQIESYDMSLQNFRISGYTLGSSRSFINTFTDHAINVKKLRAMIYRALWSKQSCTTLVALAAAALRTIDAVEDHYSHLLAATNTVLQLQALIDRPSQIVEQSLKIMAAALKVRTDVDILSEIWHSVLRLEDAQSWMSRILLSILEAVSEPWSHSVDMALGLSSSKSEIALDTSVILQDWPTWIGQVHAERMDEIAENVQILKDEKPEHPLVRKTKTKNLISAHADFAVKNIESIQRRAASYEADMLAAMEDFDINALQIRAERIIMHVGSEPLENCWELPTLCITDFDKPHVNEMNLLPHMQTDLEKVVRRALDPTFDDYDFATPLSLVPSLHFKAVIETQAGLVNQACLRLIFREYALRSHMSLQNRFYLLADGVFSSQLAHALFDAGPPPTERRKGHQRYGFSGLRLGHRDTWPPASSELRLALNGILTESFKSASGLPKLDTYDEVPGNLSFSVRTMSEEALQRCMDPNNIEALDFLTIRYHVPKPLQTIFTDSASAKYDLVFKQLLRCQRMLHTVKQLCHPGGIRGKVASNGNLHARRFRIEAHHFVSSICAYFHDRIEDEKGLLHSQLIDVERHLDTYTFRRDESPKTLRDFHERILDRILSALFLGKRQTQVLRLLEDIFSLSLVFAKESRSDTQPDTRSQESYQTLGKKLVAFMRACKELSEREDPTPGLDRRGCSGDGSKIGDLLSTLNWNGYYDELRCR